MSERAAGVARDSGAEVRLCCLLWARDGLAAALAAYEDAVLALVSEHGGEVVHRARRSRSEEDDAAGPTSPPDEVQFFRFPAQAALDAYLADPRRAALSGERDRVVARTELFPVEFG